MVCSSVYIVSMCQSSIHMDWQDPNRSTLNPPHCPLPKVLPGAMSSISIAKENVIYLTGPPSYIAPLVLLLVDRGQHEHSAWSIALQPLGAGCNALCILLPLSLFAFASIYISVFFFFIFVT